jgi:hypothetical protein
MSAGAYFGNCGRGPTKAIRVSNFYYHSIKSPARKLTNDKKFRRPSDHMIQW